MKRHLVLNADIDTLDDVNLPTRRPIGPDNPAVSKVSM